MNIDCRGSSSVSLTRVSPPRIPPGAPTLQSNSAVNGANFLAGPLAPDSWVDLFGENLATQFLLDSNLPDSLDGTTLDITDSGGASRRARLHFVTQERVQFLMPRDLASGPATLRVTNSSGASTTLAIEIARVSPGLFAANANGQGPAAASFLRVRADGSRSEEFTFTLDAPPSRTNVPIDLGPEGDEVYVSFFGTGFRFQNATRVEMRGVPVPVLGAVAQGEFEGLDQLVVGPLPRVLIG